MIWLVLVAALVGHEFSHALALRSFRVRFAPRLWYSRKAPWVGVGWCYQLDGLTRERRRTILAVGPLVEAVIWALGALLVPQYAVGLLLMAPLTLVLNRFIPGGDLWKVRHIPLPAPAISS